MTYFIGLPLPVTCYDKLIRSPFKPVPVEERHLTLLYLGSKSLGEEAIKELGEIAGAASRFTLIFEGLKPFPSWSRIRYLAAVPKPNHMLGELRLSLLRRLGHLGEDRWEAFKPHVSIAYTRLKTSLQLVETVEEIVKAARKVRCMLKTSQLAFYSASRGRYHVLKAFPLGFYDTA